MKPTIVVDTNLFIAGRWNPESHSSRIIDLVLEDKVNAVYTFEIKDENLFILEKVDPPKDFLDKIIRFYQHAQKVVPKRTISICPDPSDNRYLEAADVGKADYIVSSDHHLLDLEFFAGARIVKPGEFISDLEKDMLEEERKDKDAARTKSLVRSRPPRNRKRRSGKPSSGQDNKGRKHASGNRDPAKKKRSRRPRRRPTPSSAKKD
ncbi:putative toxin-antitoxin system toxin component, PIN family [Candidatus Altiarchaeota archaeon]